MGISFPIKRTINKGTSYPKTQIHHTLLESIKVLCLVMGFLKRPDHLIVPHISLKLSLYNWWVVVTSVGLMWDFYDKGMGCRHSWPLLCFHASNIRTIVVLDKIVKASLSCLFLSLIIIAMYRFLHVKLIHGTKPHNLFFQFFLY